MSRIYVFIISIVVLFISIGCAGTAPPAATPATPAASPTPDIHTAIIGAWEKNNS